MNMGDALAWIATHPRPLWQEGEAAADYNTRLENWIFDYSMMCESIHDEKHDAKGFPTN